MRHGKKFNHLSRQSGHRQALLSNLATSLIVHKRIKTTVAKAKEISERIESLQYDINLCKALIAQPSDFRITIEEKDIRKWITRKKI